MSHLSSICLCDGGAYLDVKVVEVLGPGDEGLTQVNAGQAVHLYASSVLDAPSGVFTRNKLWVYFSKKTWFDKNSYLLN